MAAQGKPPIETLAQIQKVYPEATDAITFVERLSQQNDWIKLERVTEQDLDAVFSMNSIVATLTSSQLFRLFFLAFCGTFNTVDQFTTMKAMLFRGTYLTLRGIVLSAGSLLVSATLGRSGWKLYLPSGVKQCPDWAVFVLACCELELAPILMLYERRNKQVPECEFTEDLRGKVEALSALKTQKSSNLSPAVLCNLLYRRKLRGIKSDHFKKASLPTTSFVLPSIALTNNKQPAEVAIREEVKKPPDSVPNPLGTMPPPLASFLQ